MLVSASNYALMRVAEQAKTLRPTHCGAARADFSEPATRFKLTSPACEAGPNDTAVIKQMAMDLARNPKNKHNLKGRLKLANLSPDYLETHSIARRVNLKRFPWPSFCHRNVNLLDHHSAKFAGASGGEA